MVSKIDVHKKMPPRPEEAVLPRAAVRKLHRDESNHEPHSPDLYVRPSPQAFPPSTRSSNVGIARGAAQVGRTSQISRRASPGHQNQGHTLHMSMREEIARRPNTQREQGKHHYGERQPYLPSAHARQAPSNTDQFKAAKFDPYLATTDPYMSFDPGGARAAPSTAKRRKAKEQTDDGVACKKTKKEKADITTDVNTKEGVPSFPAEKHKEGRRQSSVAVPPAVRRLLLRCWARVQAAKDYWEHDAKEPASIKRGKQGDDPQDRHSVVSNAGARTGSSDLAAMHEVEQSQLPEAPGRPKSDVYSETVVPGVAARLQLHAAESVLGLGLAKTLDKLTTSAAALQDSVHNQSARDERATAALTRQIDSMRPRAVLALEYLAWARTAGGEAGESETVTAAIGAAQADLAAKSIDLATIVKRLESCGDVPESGSGASRARAASAARHLLEFLPQTSDERRADSHPKASTQGSKPRKARGLVQQDRTVVHKGKESMPQSVDAKTPQPTGAQQDIDDVCMDGSDGNECAPGAADQHQPPKQLEDVLFSYDHVQDKSSATLDSLPCANMSCPVNLELSPSENDTTRQSYEEAPSDGGNNAKPAGMLPADTTDMKKAKKDLPSDKGDDPLTRERDNFDVQKDPEATFQASPSPTHASAAWWSEVSSKPPTGNSRPRASLVPRDRCASNSSRGSFSRSRLPENRRRHRRSLSRRVHVEAQQGESSKPRSSHDMQRRWLARSLRRTRSGARSATRSLQPVRLLLRKKSTKTVWLRCDETPHSTRQGETEAMGHEALHENWRSSLREHAQRKRLPARRTETRPLPSQLEPGNLSVRRHSRGP